MISGVNAVGDVDEGDLLVSVAKGEWLFGAV